MYFNKSDLSWRISQCCQFHNATLAKKYNLGTTTKTTASTPVGKAKVQSKALDNCSKLIKILSEYFSKQPKNLRCFRISSELFPCYTLDFVSPWYEEIMPKIKELMKEAGRIAKENEIRLSVHPGQFTVLASDKKDVVMNSIKDVEYHALYGILMELPPEDFVVNIHLQGLYGGKHSDGIKRFANSFNELSDYAKLCLAVEHEDKPNGYDIKHTLDLASIIPTRCTLDTHHYMCHRMTQNEKVKVNNKVVNRKIRDVEPLTISNKYFKEAVKTWGKVRPLFHKSQSFPLENLDYWMKPAAHSDIYHDECLMATVVPMLEYADFEVEAKNKEIAVQHFYKFINEEIDYAGEPLVCKSYV